MTKLLYAKHMDQLNAQAHIIESISQPESIILVLDQTVFYPQGGGQPSDIGTIQNGTTVFAVQSVAMQEDGRVAHKGMYLHGEPFEIGDTVTLHVDTTVRDLHNRNHTAGHLIDCALELLGYTFVPHKAYHFPQGPYVEYQATLEQPERDALFAKLEPAVNELVARDLPVTINFIDNDPKQRVMCIDTYAPIRCGGTHVLNTAAVKHITIRKIKNEKGNLRVSYAVE